MGVQRYAAMGDVWGGWVAGGRDDMHAGPISLDCRSFYF